MHRAPQKSKLARPAATLEAKASNGDAPLAADAWRSNGDTGGRLELYAASLLTVTPAKAGVPLSVSTCGHQSGMPAFAGMTGEIEPDLR